ncbi:NADPH:quinone reductase [Lentzea sp. NBRC 105346]|uniref:NADP-dependent oxidoreductase n=1 Tax=Lentzea sp. NBRC 105346 TaxID=3032205 RepID=UPI0024A1DF89|nr:NADP-dependent oxidoreductase [Lentzea sp. NBRC 105346]GLZ28559.1 NADPH:quinone reductase [Lentzea sp. NBRC 105346]
MRALNVPAPGERPQVSELPAPVVIDGHVLIKVKAAGLNALDRGVAAGLLAGLMPHEYPLVIGRDAAGVVEEVGAGVDDIAVGDEVFGHLTVVPPIHAGTVAEYAVLPADSVAAKPVALDFVAAAAIPIAGAAAVGAVDAIDPGPGEVVLVNGASGGVGSYAVQLLADRGATVIATGLPGDAARLIGLGATEVVDHTAGSVVDRVRAAYPDGVDALLEVSVYPSDPSILAAVRKGGKVASTTNSADEDTLAAAGLTGTNIIAQPVRAVIGAIAERAAAGLLKIDVETVLPLDEATDGLEMFTSGHVAGKIVIEV